MGKFHLLPARGSYASHQKWNYSKRKKRDVRTNAKGQYHYAHGAKTKSGRWRVYH